MGNFIPSASGPSIDAYQVLTELEKKRIERELAIVELLNQRRRAFELASEKEKLNWSSSGGLLTSVLSILSSYHHKNLLHLLPIIPIATYLGYKAHFCYGNKSQLIQDAADTMMKYDNDVFSASPLTVADVKSKIKELRLLKESDI